MSDRRAGGGEHSEDELIDEAAYGVMEGVNEGGHSWENDDILRRFAEYGIGGLPLDESHIDEIVDRAKEQYAPTSEHTGQSDTDHGDDSDD